MKNFISTLLVCSIALPAFGQQSPAQNGTAAVAPPAPVLRQGTNPWRERSHKRLSTEAPQSANATGLTAHVSPRDSVQSAYQGVWSSAITYSQSQSVLYSGAIYYSAINNNVANNPGTSPSAWTFLAPGGSQSPCGAATIYGPCILTVNDLPPIPSAQVTGLAAVATSGSYRDLVNAPALGTAATQNTSAFDPAGAAAAITLSGLGGVTSSQAAAAAPVQSVAGRTGAISLTTTDISGLGTAATQNTSAFDPAGAAAAITLSGLGGVTSTQAAAAAPVQSVAGRTGTVSLTASDISGLGTAATQSTSAFDPAGAAAAITLSGLGGVTATQAAAAAPVQGVKVNGGSLQTGTVSLTIPSAQVAANLASSGVTGVTGILPLSNGGTGGTSQQGAINALTGTQSAGKYLRSDGSNATLSSIQASDIPVLNQNTSGNAATATSATNIAGGSTGAIHYQSAAGSTTFLAGNTAATDQVVVSHGTGTAATAPSLSNAPGLSAANMTNFPVLNQNTTGNAATATSAISATSASNLASGAVGAIPYQSATGATTFLSGNTAASDQVVISHGSGSAATAPSLTNAPALSAANMTNFPVLNQNTSGNAATATSASSASNLASGAVGAIPYQSATGATTFLSGNTAASDQVVISHGSGSAATAPSLSNAPALSAANMTNFPVLNQNTSGNAATATSATNIAGGSTGAIHYQSATGTTTFLAGNTAATDQVLVSHGTGSVAAAPSLSNAPALSAANMTNFPVFNQNTTGNAATATSASSASNLASGAVGAIPYQSATGATTFLSGNTAASDQVLISHGSGAAATAPSLSNAPALSAANMTNFPALNYLSPSNNLSEISNATTARGNLGLGSIATLAAPTGSVVGSGQANTYSAGAKQIFTPSSTTAGEGVTGVAADPTSLTAGDRWFRTDLKHMRVYDGTTVQTLAWISDIGTGGGSVSSVGVSTVPSWLTASFSNATTTPSLTLSSAASQTSHQVIGTCGSASSFGPCALTGTDLPTATSSVPGAVQVATTSGLKVTSGAIAVDSTQGGEYPAKTLGFACDGTTDDSAAFNAVSNKVVHLPDYSTCIGYNLSLGSNVKYTCKNCTIRHNTTDTSHYLLNLSYVSNVEFDGVTFDNYGVNTGSYSGTGISTSAVTVTNGGSNFPPGVKLGFTLTGGTGGTSPMGVLQVNSSGVVSSATLTSPGSDTTVPTGISLTGCNPPGTSTFTCTGLTVSIAALTNATPSHYPYIAQVFNTTNFVCRNCRMINTGATAGNLSLYTGGFYFYQTSYTLDNLRMDDSLVGGTQVEDDAGSQDNPRVVRNAYLLGSTQNALQFKGSAANVEVSGGTIKNVTDAQYGNGANGNGLSIFGASNLRVHDLYVNNVQFSCFRVTGTTAFNNHITHSMCMNTGEGAAYTELGAYNNIMDYDRFINVDSGLHGTNANSRPNLGKNFFDHNFVKNCTSYGAEMEHDDFTNNDITDCNIGLQIGNGSTTGRGMIITGNSFHSTGAGTYSPGMTIGIDVDAGIPSSLGNQSGTQISQNSIDSSVTIPVIALNNPSGIGISSVASCNTTQTCVTLFSAPGTAVAVGQVYILSDEWYTGMYQMNGQLCQVTAVTSTTQFTCGNLNSSSWGTFTGWTTGGPHMLLVSSSTTTPYTAYYTWPASVGWQPLGTLYSVASSATPTFDFSRGAIQSMTVTANTSPVVTSLGAGMRGAIVLCNSTSNAYTVTWPSNVTGLSTSVAASSGCVAQQVLSLDGISLIKD